MIHIHEGPKNNLLIFHMDEVDRRDNGKQLLYQRGILEDNMSSMFCYCCQGLYIFPKTTKENESCTVEYKQAK